MRAPLLSLVMLAAPAALWAPGCGGDSGTTTDPMTENAQDAVVIDESGDGQVFDVVVGQKVVVRLPANPSTGYDWQVASTDKTFGYPVDSTFESCGGAVGSGGVRELVWETSGPLPMEGAHTVVLDYRRSWEEEPAKTFTFTVNVVSPGQSGPQPLVIDESGNGETFEVTEGAEVVVRLEGNPTTGYAWKVVSVDKTFGYPTEDFIAGEGAVGSGGVYEFVWQTTGPFPMLGTHAVKLGYFKGSATKPAETFAFTVEIVAAD